MTMIPSDRPPINADNVLSGRYLCRFVAQDKFPEADRGRDLMSVKIGDFFFCARNGGSLSILQYNDEGKLQKMRVLNSITCHRLAARNNKLYVDRNGFLLELDFNSSKAQTHFADSKIGSLFRAIL